MLTIAIGYDHRESIAFYVLAHSIMRRATKPVRIIPLATSTLSDVYNRPRSPKQSTDFTYTRFLTPSFAEANQVSVFLDSDMLCLTDICELETIAKHNLYADVLVVKHDYDPVSETKFLNQPQTTYPCKNWSSMMVFNGHRQAVVNLNPAVVNYADAMFLHQFGWAHDVVGLDPAWNHLVGEYEPNPNAKIVHFTNGGPWFKGYEKCEYAEAWLDELEDMLHRDNRSFDLSVLWR
jgi:lipopolysaccharide biosynthesis glycosyltransferase